MKTEHWLKLTKSEISHVLTLIDNNEREGWYYSPKGQYWDRSNRIKKKLKNMLAPKDTAFEDIGVGDYSGGEFYKY